MQRVAWYGVAAGHPQTPYACALCHQFVGCSLNLEGLLTGWVIICVCIAPAPCISGRNQFTKVSKSNDLSILDRLHLNPHRKISLFSTPLKRRKCVNFSGHLYAEEAIIPCQQKSLDRPYQIYHTVQRIRSNSHHVGDGRGYKTYNKS